jgi:signal transduction histidine kinase
MHQAGRTEKLANNMLGFACESPLEIVPVDLRQLLSDAIGLTRASRHHHTRVEIHSEATLPRAAADANRMLQVFLQIMENAIDATEEKGRGSLLIGLRAVDQRVEVEFADDGVGLQEPERVFDPFYTTKPVGQGIGLGLSTCYGIIRQHHGEIVCRNRPGGGAIFTVSLPAFSEVPSRLALAGVSRMEGT